MNETAKPPVRVPTLRAALRAAATDFYYQSLRLVPANAAWGGALLALLAIAFWLSPLLAFIAAPLLALPFVGIARMAAQTVRGEDVVLSDLVTAIRNYAPAALAAGVVGELATVTLTANVIGGIAGGGPLGWGFATLAAWGLAGLWIGGISFWPLLVDPAREGVPLIALLRLAALVVLTSPLRFAILGAALAAIAFLSTVAFAALLSVSVAFMALVACRVTLPAADELAARRAAPAHATGSIGRA